MKRKISLNEFIESIKTELFEASQKGAKNPMFSIEDIELETEFSIETEGKAGFSFVVDLETRAKGVQMHHVKLRLKPIPPSGDHPSEKTFTWIEDQKGEPKVVVEVMPEKDSTKVRG